MNRLGFFLIVVFCLVYGLTAEESSNKVETNKENTETKKVMKTEEEWKAQLTTEEFRILRKAGTERPNEKINEEIKKHAPKKQTGMPRRLGRYLIERRIGKGAMGAVYLAKDPRINRSVAVKAIPIEKEFEDDELFD